MIAATVQGLVAFNLVCTVTFERAPEMGRVPTEIRVDLESRRFCLAQCFRALPMVSVSDTEIVFQDHWVAPANITFVRRVYNRATGAYSAVVRTRVEYGFVENLNSGTCVVAPFTGFQTSR